MDSDTKIGLMALAVITALAALSALANADIALTYNSISGNLIIAETGVTSNALCPGCAYRITTNTLTLTNVTEANTRLFYVPSTATISSTSPPAISYTAVIGGGSLNIGNNVFIINPPAISNTMSITPSPDTQFLTYTQPNVLFAAIVAPVPPPPRCTLTGSATPNWTGPITILDNAGPCNVSYTILRIPPLRLYQSLYPGNAYANATFGLGFNALYPTPKTYNAMPGANTATLNNVTIISPNLISNTLVINASSNKSGAFTPANGISLSYVLNLILPKPRTCNYTATLTPSHNSTTITNTIFPCDLNLTLLRIPPPSNIVELGFGGNMIIQGTNVYAPSLSSLESDNVLYPLYSSYVSPLNCVNIDIINTTDPNAPGNFVQIALCLQPKNETAPSIFAACTSYNLKYNLTFKGLYDCLISSQQTANASAVFWHSQSNKFYIEKFHADSNATFFYSQMILAQNNSDHAVTVIVLLVVGLLAELRFGKTLLNRRKEKETPLTPEPPEAPEGLD